MIRDHDQLTLEVTADDSITTADTSVSLGLIVTELVINALKHAFPGDRKGTITVDYRSRGASWTLAVGDDGVGMPVHSDGAKAGLGTSIIQALAQQLGAQITVAGVNPGTKISVTRTFVPVLVGQAVASPTGPFRQGRQEMVEKNPLTIPQYERMAAELEVMSDMIRARPEMNHHFAERLATLAREMREDEVRVYPALGA